MSSVTGATLLLDGFNRVRQAVHQVLDGVGSDVLHDRLDGQTNSIAWLIWHLTRVQDDHLAEAAGREQVWTQDGWYDRFGLPFPPAAHGYGMSSADVGQVVVESATLLAGYHDAVHDRTVEWVGALPDRELSRIVDESFDPPVTLAVRLVSVLTDDLQHAGQAAFLRGILQRR